MRKVPTWLALVGFTVLSMTLPASAQDDDGDPPDAPPAASDAPPAAPDAPPAASDAPPAASDAPPAASDAPPAASDAPPAASDAPPDAPPPSQPAPAGQPEDNGDAPQEGEYVEEAPGSDDYDLADAAAAGYEGGEATNDSAEGLGVDGKDYELDEATFEGMEGLDAADLEALTEVTPAELGELEMERDMSPEAEAQFEEQAEALSGLDPDDLDKLAALYIGVLRSKLHEVRDKTHDKTVDKIRAKNDARVGKVTGILAWLSLSGILLLLLPFVQKNKYPGQTGKLLGYSAMAGAALTLAILMLTGVLFAMRTVQGAMAEQTNPQLVVQDAAFDAADDHLEDVAAMPGLLLVPLQQVSTGEQEDLGVAILENAAQFQEDFQVFKSVAGHLKAMQGVMGYVPTVLIVLAIALFFVAIKDLVRDIVKAPERAMKGEIKATEVFTLVLKRVGNEMLVSLGVLAALFVITILTSIALSFVAIPAMSMFVGQLLATLEYVFVQPGASKAYVYIALMGVLVFMLLAIVVILASGILYLGKLQAILRARLNNKIPLSTFKPFFGWRTLALLWCLALPVGVLFGGAALSDYLVDKGTSGPKHDWTLALLPAPITLVVGFLLVFTLGYGLKALLAIAKYKVVGAPVGEAALEQAAQALPSK
jgi:hypothetical protein